MKNLMKLIRVKHWLKNLLVFIPIFFSLNIVNINYLQYCLFSFLIFSASSSIVYIINDICDIEDDKKHPIKKNRPLASGAISIKKATIILLILSLILLILVFSLYKLINNVFIIIIPILYIILNLLYSKFLKKIPIIDVTIIVIGFVLRVIYGAIATSIVVSKYLYLMIIFGGFYLGFCKRRNEIIQIGNRSRSVLNDYNKEFLDKNMYVADTLTIVAYTLWSVDSTAVIKTGNDYRFWTIPIVMLILQLYSFNVEKNSFGDPIDVLFSDKKLFILTIIYIIVMILILYIL